MFVRRRDGRKRREVQSIERCAKAMSPDPLFVIAECLPQRPLPDRPPEVLANRELRPVPVAPELESGTMIGKLALKGWA